jgi:hypothetical protein
MRGRGRAGGRRAVAGLVVLGCVAVLGLPTSAAFAAAVPGTVLGPWTIGRVLAWPSGQADEGVATLTRPDGSVQVITRGAADLSPALLARGWVHIGDPDSRSGYLIDAYQGRSSATAKLFAITGPDGRVSYLEHPLSVGETFHNSFAAFTPGRTAFVSGEWGTMSRLLVFGTPTLAPAAPLRYQTIALASTIRLTHPMRDVQGCVFGSGTTLLCSTDDPGTDLYPVARQLLAVHLDHQIDPHDPTPVIGSPRLVGPVPQDPLCAGPGETEGIDLHAHTLRIAVNSPCRPVTLLSDYVRTPYDDDD